MFKLEGKKMPKLKKTSKSLLTLMNSYLVFQVLKVPYAIHI